MKLHSILTTAALASLVALLAGLALNFGAVVFFAGSASLLIVLIGATDYGARPSYGSRVAATLRLRERMPLAA